MTPTPSDACERELIEAEACLRRAMSMYPECDTEMLLSFPDRAKTLSALAKTVGDNAQDEVGKRFPKDEKVMEVRGVEFVRSKPPPSRTGWRVQDWTDEDGKQHVGLLQTVLDTPRADKNGEPLTPAAKLLEVWTLGAPKLTALDDYGIGRDDFCTVTWSDDKKWKVTSVAEKEAHKKRRKK